MIKGVFIINNNGLVRLSRFFLPTELPAQQAVIRRIFRSVSARPDSMCNYLELSIEDWGECKVVYRHYATLYFIFIVDRQESDLGILDLIQVFVESLDKCFENVCELDIIFHSDKVNFVLDEICAAGMVLETNIVQILQAVHDQNKLHKKSEGGVTLVVPSLGKDSSDGRKF
mmetsp:Transcript_43938/g.99288  ORF Transcript_43938/g.99288 Transcript_43938/m.99288 type:complete len:172 (-) Transcript_43938:317-832(-)